MRLLRYAKVNPDGNEIVFNLSNSDGGAIYKVRADGKRDPILLTGNEYGKKPGVFTHPNWNPDGNRFVFLLGDERSYRESYGPGAFKSNEKIMWISSNGGRMNTIAESKGRSYPHFVKGKERIYLFNYSNGLVSIKWDGTDEKKIVKVTGSTPYGSGDRTNPSNASLIMISPNGDKGLAKINNNLYSFVIPYSGLESLKISLSNPDSSSFPARKLSKIEANFFLGTYSDIIYWSLKSFFI